MKNRCQWNFKPGWVCTRTNEHGGPCALKPKWWNVVEKVRVWRYR